MFAEDIALVRQIVREEISKAIAAIPVKAVKQEPVKQEPVNPVVDTETPAVKAGKKEKL